MSEPSTPGVAPARRLSRRSIALLVTAGVVVLALTATAVAFAVAPRPPAVPAAEPPASPAPTPTPTPTIEPANRPAPRIDAACDDILSAGTAASALGGSEVAPVQSRLASLLDAAKIQVGMWECSWGHDPQNPKGDRLMVTLVPGITESIDRYFEEPPGSPGCSAHEGISYCSHNTLVGDVWVSVWLIDGRGDDALAILTSVSAEVVAATAELPPADERWVHPTTPFTSEAMESLDPAIIAGAFGLPDPYPTGTDISGTIAYAMNEVGLVWPDWTSYGSDRYISVTTLPGGGWAAADLAQLPGAAPVEIAGTEDASMETGEYVTICFSIVESAMCVTEKGADPATLLEQTRAFVAALPTS